MELRKTLVSRVVLSTTVLLVAGIALLAGTLTLAADNGNQQVLAQLGPIADRSGWDRLLGIAAQVTGAAALLGFGVTLSWIFGREFTDGTISGLFALPVSRPAIALAKLTVYLAWTLVVAALLVLTLGITCAALGSWPPSTGSPATLLRQFTLTALSAVLALPAAWAATLGRGPLPGIATTIVTIVLAQIGVVAGGGAWFPLAAPALWALDPGQANAGQLALVAVVPVLAVPAILLGWHRLTLDR